MNFRLVVQINIFTDILEFYYNAHTGEDSMYFYKDIKLKKYQNFKKVDFYLGSDTNELLVESLDFT